MTKFSELLEKIQRRFNRFQSVLRTKKDIWQLGKIKNQDFSNFHITSTGATDGGASQLLRQLSTISFTNYFGFSYIHTPLSKIAHNTKNDPDWAKKWENYLNLSSLADEQNSPAIEFEILQSSYNLLTEILHQIVQPSDHYIQIRHSHRFTNFVPKSYLLIQDDLRKAHNQNRRSVNLIFNKNRFNIAIHVRRGDVTEESMPERFTSAQKIKNVIQRVKKCLENENIEHTIYLFCINHDEDLTKLETENVQIIDELDIFDVMDHLIHSDLLVTSKSSVSYVSGILNENIVLFEPFWHPSLPGWLNMDDKFETQLEKKITNNKMDLH